MTSATAAGPTTDAALSFTTLATPVGTVKLVASSRGLAAILWENDDRKRVRLGRMTDHPRHEVLVETSRQLREYFAGKRTVFSLPLDFVGTPFQQQVWTAMCAIPYGTTRTYGELAKAIGNPGSVRAVGAANGRNPIAVVGPCHRVIGATGALTGFAGGLANKAFLLRLEGIATQEIPAP